MLLNVNVHDLHLCKVREIANFNRTIKLLILIWDISFPRLLNFISFLQLLPSFFLSLWSSTLSYPCNVHACLILEISVCTYFILKVQHSFLSSRDGADMNQHI
jgi:hypothetical protein